MKHKGGVGTWSDSVEESEIPLSEEDYSKLCLSYPEFGEYDQLIRLDRIPTVVRETILEVYRQRSFLRLGSISNETSNAIKNLRSDDAYLRRALRAKVPDPDPKRKSTRMWLISPI